MVSSILGAVLPGALRRSLIAKFVVTLVTLALLVGAVGFAATGHIRAETTDNVEREFRGVAQSKATLVTEWYEENQQVASLVSEHEELKGTADSEELRGHLRTERSKLRSDVKSLHLLDTGSGNTPSKLATTASNGRVPAPLQSWLAKQRFEQVNDVMVSPPYNSGGQKVIAFASPVGAGQSRVLVMEVGFASLSRTLRTSGATLSKVQVVNSQNTIVAAQSGSDTSESVVGAKYASGSALKPVKRARKLRSKDGGAGVINRMPASKVIEEPYTAGYAPVRGTDWVVVVHAPRSQLFGFVQTVSNLGLLASGILVLLVGGVGVGLGYSVTSSINRLADKAKEMEEGDLGVDLSTDRVDEIGELYQSFANMRDEVRQRILDEQEAREEAEAARAETAEVKADVRELANHLERKADEYSDVMRTCAAGDLTQRLDTQSRSKAMREIGTEFNEMISELEVAIDQTKDFADEVVDQSEIVMEGAESVNDASEQVARSIQQISDEADQQRERIEGIADDLHAVAKSLEDLPDERLDDDLRQQLAVVEELCEEIDDVAAFSEETLAEAENVAAAAEEQTSALTEVSQSARDLSEYADPLGEELDRFTTDAEMEFQFGKAATPPDEE